MFVSFVLVIVPSRPQAPGLSECCQQGLADPGLAVLTVLQPGQHGEPRTVESQTWRAALCEVFAVGVSLLAGRADGAPCPATCLLVPGELVQSVCCCFLHPVLGLQLSPCTSQRDGFNHQRERIGCASWVQSSGCRASVGKTSTVRPST